MTSAVNGWPPIALHNAQHTTVRNLTLQGPAWELVRATGGHHITLSENTLRWASFAAITLDDGGVAGTQHMRIERNLITQTACGVYLIAMHTWQNSNDLYCGHNRFIDIDTEDFYGNGDTHAIGIQGGSRNLFDHNIIDGAGGSGITFYQGPDNENGTPPQEMHDNVVR